MNFLLAAGQVRDDSRAAALLGILLRQTTLPATQPDRDLVRPIAKTGAASQPAMTVAQRPPSPPLRSPLPSSSGFDDQCVWARRRARQGDMRRAGYVVMTRRVTAKRIFFGGFFGGYLRKSAKKAAISKASGGGNTTAVQPSPFGSS
jgi:hypothetical protein